MIDELAMIARDCNTVPVLSYDSAIVVVSWVVSALLLLSLNIMAFRLGWDIYQFLAVNVITIVAVMLIHFLDGFFFLTDAYIHEVK